MDTGFGSIKRDQTQPHFKDLASGLVLACIILTPHLLMLQYELLSGPSRDITEHVGITETWPDAIEQLHTDPVVGHIKAHSSAATFISFNYAERMTSEQGFCTHWDMALWHISWGLNPHASPLSQRLISPSSSFHSSVNDITHLSPGLSRVSGTAGVVPGAAILGNINQNSSWLRQRETKGKRSSRPLLYFLRSHSYKLRAE